MSVSASSSAEDQPVREFGILLSGSRRDLFSFAITSVSAVTLACGILSNPAYAEDIGSNSENPIVVLGAGGKVCLSENIERIRIRITFELLLTTTDFI